MKSLVVATLVLTVVCSPVPDDYRRQEAFKALESSETVPLGHHQMMIDYVAIPAVQHVAVPVQSYRTSYFVSRSPLEPTPEVQQATAAFMSSWNEAAARASKIQSIMYKGPPVGSYVFHNPTQVQETEEVKIATAEFMAAWNEAARQATTVENAIYTTSQPVYSTAEVHQATTELINSWEAAAQQAGVIQKAVCDSQVPQEVDHTEEVKKATAEFLAAWKEAAARVPKIETTMYQIAGTTASSTPQYMAGSTPQFTPSVEHATAEFMKAWNAAAEAAAAAPDVNIIMGASSHSQAPSVLHHSPVTVTFSSAPSSSYVLPHPVQPTPEVQEATAAFMAAWNKAAAQASKIQTNLVRSSAIGHFEIQIPQQVEATEEVKRATADFMAAWNEAAQRSATVEHAMYNAAQSFEETSAIRETTSEFMSAWKTAAQQASTIREAFRVSGIPAQIDHTEEVKKATVEFMAAWKEAAARVPKIETTMYQIAGTTASSTPQYMAGSTPQFTPSVEHATAEFMKAWNAAAEAAAAAPDVNIIMGASSHSQAPSVLHRSPVTVTFSSAPSSSYVLPHPVQPTPEVQEATAAFMAAWNKAAAQASKIQTNLVRSSAIGHFEIQIPQQVEATEEVKRATADFMAAWNEAAQRSTTVEHAMYNAAQSFEETSAIRETTSEFMSAWKTAAQQASTIREAFRVSGIPAQVDHTEEVKKATAKFMAAWEEAASRVPKIETTMYQIAGTTASSIPQYIVGSTPQFTPSVEHSTAEFMKAWNAAAEAAAAAPDVNIIMGASSHSQAPSVLHRSPVTVTFSSAPSSSYVLPHPVQPTPEVQEATAAFMAAWNKAAAQASKIQTNLVRSSAIGHFEIQIPQQVEATEEVKRATADFMAAWNEAAQRSTTVEHAMYNAAQSFEETSAIRETTSEFMSAWKTAAQQASTIREAFRVSGIPAQVDHTEEVKKATAKFMAAWEEAASRVPKIETTMYQIAGTTASSIPQYIVGSTPQFTPSVEHSTAEFMKAWNAAAEAAAAAPDVNIIMGASSHSQAPSVLHRSPVTVTFSSAPSSSYVLPHPVQPTPEVQEATAAFMAAWNKAAAQASKIQTNLVRSSAIGHFEIQIPQQVEATEEVKRATADFMAAWNEAAQRSTTVEHAMYNAAQSFEETSAIRETTSEFMSAWKTAAQQASTIREAFRVSGIPAQVDHTEEVKKATAKFMAAWEEAAARVPKIETTMYQIAGTTTSSTPQHMVESTPQFSPSVEKATAEFMKTWNAAAAAAASAPDVNIIMGGSSHATPTTELHHSHGSVQYSATPRPTYGATYDRIPQPAQFTPEVQEATAAFMGAWNAAAERANKIQETLIHTTPDGKKIEAPLRVEETEAVKKACAEFMAAWNAAAQRGSVVEQAVSSLPQQIKETKDVKKATAEFMAAWHTAAEEASAIREILPTALQQVPAAQEIEKYTTVFLHAWNEAADRIPMIESTMYTLSGSAAVARPEMALVLGSSHLPVAVVGTPEVLAAREDFMTKFHEAEAAALRTSINRGVLPAPTVLSVSPAHRVVYASNTPQQGCIFNGRIFSPFAGLPLYVPVTNKLF
ncbi:hypothetical protein SK128_002587 [Halocaridina rubra]|uniref:Uncharacterized protein n=1 Tax=Halocaridina rubra TaxID=373956 RepID=A0AAN8X711_HALRR